jgi:hypothetical protein
MAQLPADPACIDGVQPRLHFSAANSGATCSSLRPTSTDPDPHATRCRRLRPASVKQPQSTPACRSITTAVTFPHVQARWSAARPL